MNSLRNIFANFLPRPKEKRDSNRSMGKKSKESLKLFGSHAAPTGWGYLSGGRSIQTPYQRSTDSIKIKMEVRLENGSGHLFCQLDASLVLI